MKVLGLTQYRAAERFLFPSASGYTPSRIVSTTPINKYRTVAESFGFLKELSELFMPVFKQISKIFG